MKKYKGHFKPHAKRMTKPGKLHKGHKSSAWRQMIVRYTAL